MKINNVFTKQNKIFFLFILTLLIFSCKNEKTSTDRATETVSQTTQLSREYHCAICRKLCGHLDEENFFQGHHVKIGGIMKSDIVCGEECDLRLRRKNEAILEQESNGYSQSNLSNYNGNYRVEQPYQHSDNVDNNVAQLNKVETGIYETETKANFGDEKN